MHLSAREYPGNCGLELPDLLHFQRQSATTSVP